MSPEESMARAICKAMGDDPDALAYPPMEHLRACKAHVIYVPTSEFHQPMPCWNWYLREAQTVLEEVGKTA